MQFETSLLYFFLYRLPPLDGVEIKLKIRFIDGELKLPWAPKIVRVDEKEGGRGGAEQGFVAPPPLSLSLSRCMHPFLWHAFRFWCSG